MKTKSIHFSLTDFPSFPFSLNSFPKIILLCLLTFTIIPSAIFAGDVKWETDLKKAIEKAKKEKKELLLDFTADWCMPCKKMDATTFKDAKLLLDMKNYICVRVDHDENPTLIGQYKITGIPAILKLNMNGRELSRSVGYVEASTFRKWLNKATSEKVLKNIGIFEKLIKKDWNNDQFDNGTNKRKNELIEVAFEGYLVKNDAHTRELAESQLKSFFKKDRKIFLPYFNDKRLGVRIFLGNQIASLNKELTYDPWENATDRKNSLEKISLFILKK